MLQSFTDRFSKQAETQSSLYFGPDQAQQQVPYDDDMSNFVEKMKGQIQNEIGKGNITEDDAYRLLANETSQMGFQGNPLHRALTDHFRSGFVERREEEGQQRSSGQTEALNKLIRQIEKKSGKVSDLGQKFQGEIDIERKKKEREEFMRTNITEHLRRLNGKANQEVNKADIRRVEKQSRRIETQKRTFTPQVSPYASTIDKRNALVRRRFAKRIEQRDAMLSKPLKEALPKGHDLRVSNREKRNSRIKKITDEIQAKRLKEDGSEDTGFNTGHKMKVLYGRLGQLIDEHPDKRDQKNLYINAITKLMDLPTREDLLYSGVDIQTIANSQIVKGRQAIAPTKGSDFQSSLSQVNQTNSFAPLNKLTGFFRGLMRGEDTDRDTLSGYGRVAGDFELIKTRDYTNKVFKDKKGRAKQTQEKYFFQRRSDGKIIDNDELARRIHNAYEGNFSGEERGLFSSKKAQGFQGATRKEQIARRIFKETGFNLGRNTTFQSAQRGSEGTPFTRATRGQPAQPDTEKFFQEEMNSATYSNRVENFILSNAKRTYEARKPLMEMAQTTAQRFRDKQEADPTPFKNTSPSFNDLAQQTQDLKGYSAVIAGTKNIETGLPKDLDVKNFPNSAIANPAEYSATQRAKREMEQVEPAFKQVMGDLSTSIALKNKKAVKPADGTTVRAQNLKRMFMEKKDKYLQDWADPSTTKLTSSLGFDTLPSQAPSVGVSNLSIEEQENIQLAQVMESLGEANEGTRGAPEQSVLDDIDEEREQTRFSEIDGALRDLTLEKVARNIVAVKKQFMASYQTMKNVQKTIEGLGDSQGNPVGTIGNAMMRGGRLQNDLINSGLMGNNLISASGGQLFAPSGQNGFGNSNMNKDWGRFGYYGVGSNKQLGWGTYYNDLATDYDNGKYPIQIITDSLTDRNYLAPTSGQFNVGGQSITNVIPVGGKRAHNGVGDIASVSKFFMGSTPVYWFHTRPNPATTNQPIRENGKLVGKIYSSGSFQHGQIRMNTLTNPLIDENPNTPLASESLSIGDTVDYFVNESGYSGSNTMYLGNQAVVDSAQQTRYGEPKYRTALDFEVSAGNILSVQEARKGTATTKLKTGEQIKSEARRRQRKALGFNFAGYTERTVQGIQ